MDQEATLELQPMHHQTVPFLINDAQQSTKAKSSVFSTLFFVPVFSTLKKAQQVALQSNMIKDLPETSSAQALHEKFKQILHAHNECKIQSALFKMFASQLILGFFVLLLNSIGQLAIPVLIKLVIDYITSADQTLEHGLQFVIVVLIVRILNVFTNSHSRAIIRNLGFEAMVVINMEIMDKSLKVSFQSNKSLTNSQVQNLMQIDAAKLQLVTTYLSGVALIPIQLGLSLFIMYRLIGISFTAGLIIILLVMFFNISMSKLIVNSQNQLLKDKDARTKCTNEIFSSIKFIKINALEEFFLAKLHSFRKQEVKSLRTRLNYSAINIFTVWVTPQMILSCTFGLYVLLGHSLSPSNTFAIISLFQILQQPLLQLPIAYNSLIETNISLNRIKSFLIAKELQTGCFRISDFRNPTVAIEVNQGNFYWPLEKNQKNQKGHFLNLISSLSIPSLTIPAGKLITIVGDVGSGKSSFFQSLLGEMNYIEGYGEPKIRINGRVAYVSQKPWIQNASVKDNILFGQQYDEIKYQQAIYYSCLQDDLDILINGDQTMIGEKGINLSGGQKARISLARALYSNSDIYLIDDPLSAVDVNVGKFLMTECFLGNLRTATRILVTHALNYCKYSDFIYLFENGKIAEFGTYEQIKQSEKFEQIYKKFHKDSEKATKVKRIQSSSSLKRVSSATTRLSSSLSSPSRPSSSIGDDLILFEDRATGAVGTEVFKSYLKFNGGYWSFILVAIIMVIWIFCYLGSGLWIATWAVQSGKEDAQYTEKVFFLVYFFFGLGQGIFAFARAYTIICQSIKSAKAIHNKMVECLIYASQCQFFERIPLGRIMNRLTKDLNTLDTEIYWNISWLYTKFGQLISNCFLNVYASTYYILFPIALFFYFCAKMERMYMKASRELHRLELISKSPILSYFSETLTGLPIIRAFSQQTHFQREFSLKLDTNRKIFYESVAANAWFVQVLGFASLIVNMTAIVYCIFYNPNAALAGLLMTYASNIDINILQTVESVGQLENGIISFERCLAYTQVQPEPGYRVKKELVESWPTKGAIEFNQFTVHYREHLPPALKEISFKIEPQTKVGIVGRTGAGKSTITLALLRILEASQGQIIIDGVDISSLSLKQLREAITIIMQDATIFEASLRENLDPHSKCTDEEITMVLQLCCLQRLLKGEGGLEMKLSEGGDNLSAGEKQLLCIARAVLKKKRIVLIDEATANIDIETEQQIQETIMRSFKDCTVITIAHRINTILHCDKIIVISRGELVEMGSTQDLLKDEDSQFYQIYQDAVSEQMCNQ